MTSTSIDFSSTSRLGGSVRLAKSTTVVATEIAKITIISNIRLTRRLIARYFPGYSLGPRILNVSDRWRSRLLQKIPLPGDSAQAAFL
jgi:hypothetical protein